MREYEKIVFILRKDVSSWKSCQHIVSNLYHSYFDLFKKSIIKKINVTQPYNSYTAYKTAHEILDWNADLIIWMDHKPCASLLVEALSNAYASISYINHPKLIVHLFGDFVIDCKEWENSKKALSCWPIHFFTASEKQKKIVESFFQSSESIVTVIPFPVDEKMFNRDNFFNDRKNIREKYGIKKDDKVLLYTGRISYQKNIEMLVKIFNSIIPLFDNTLHLWIAGPWDDIIMPYFGKNGICGSFYSHFSSTLKKIKGSNINFVGQFESVELVKLYNAADLFVSLSTYNDEDYGIAPAEALLCGLPVFLSNWGGYSSFKDYSDDVTLVPVHFLETRPNIDINPTRSALINKINELPLSAEKRKEISEKIKYSIGIESLTKKIESTLLEIKFGSVDDFTPLFIKLCENFKKNPRSSFDEQLYKEVYTDYGT